MNKRRIALLTAFLALFILFAARQGTEASASSYSLPQTTENLLDAWFALLESNEQIYSGAFRMIEYTDHYAQEPTWENLLKARASSTAAKVALLQTELPTLELADEEIDLLIDADIEINAILREFEELEGLLASKLDTADLFCRTLQQDVFLRASVEDAIPTMTEFYREYFAMEYRYLSQFTNYLLLQMDAEDRWQTWLEQLPCLAACADSWRDEDAGLKTATDEVLDKMEALQAKTGGFLGISEYTLEIVQDAAATGNMEALKKEIHVNEGVPGYFPVPAWLPDVLQLYLVTDPATQEKNLVQAGEVLDSIPSACYISCGAIPVENVEAYKEQLTLWGIATYGEWNESQDAYQMLAQSGDSLMMVEWTAEDTLLYLNEPVGCLIPELYLYAMTVK